jgi:hypothetical protein
MVVMLYADLGDKDQAFQWLNTAYQERDRLLLALNRYIQFDPLRSDPRFAELVRKVGLPHSQDDRRCLSVVPSRDRIECLSRWR